MSSFRFGDALADRAQALEAGAVGGDHAVEFQAALRLLEQAVGVEKLVFLRDGILVPADDLLAFVLQRQRQAELRADAIAVRPDVADDAKGLALADGVEDAVNDFRMTFHSLIILASRRGFFQFLDDLEHAVAAHDGIVQGKFQRRRVFQDDGAADQALDADAMVVEQLKAALLLVGDCRGC